MKKNVRPKSYNKNSALHHKFWAQSDIEAIPCISIKTEKHEKDITTSSSMCTTLNSPGSLWEC